MVKKSNKTSGFTIVELIIVIAVIGVLAAILIPTFSNIIEKANLKSATSDARNALTQYLSEKAETGEPISDSLFFVEKAKKMYVFGYFGGDGELVGSPSNPYDMSAYATRGTSSLESKVTTFLSKLAANGEVVAANDAPQSEKTANLAENTCIWSGYSLVVLEEAATTATATAYVSLSSQGSLVLTHKKVMVYDVDADGALTINDTLILAHKNNYSGGQAGYGTSVGQWGLGISKLWGVENGGSYGYYVNNASAWSLTDPIADNDYLYAFSYTDAATYTDSFSYFDKSAADVAKGESVTLKLTYAGYDADWNTVTMPLADATITINGVATSYKTDANGDVTIPMNTAGTFTISATTTNAAITYLVPPCCMVTVSGS